MKVTAGELRKVGDQVFFEYHCWESDQSSDAELWYHSHQPITIIAFAENDGCDIPAEQERAEAGSPFVYRVQFNDGFEADALEDELLDSPKEYQRPDPPRRRR